MNARRVNKMTDWWHSGLLLIWTWTSVIAQTNAELYQVVAISVDGQPVPNGHHVSPGKVLDCQGLSGQSSPGSLKWRLDGGPLSDTFSSIEAKQTAECFATMQDGSVAYAFVKITTNNELSDENFAVKINIKKGRIIQGTNVVVHCEASGRETGLKLLKNAEELAGVEQTTEHNGNRFVRSFQLPNIEPNATAIYGCLGLDENGDPVSFAETKLLVNFKPVLNEVPQAAYSVKTFGSLVLRCSSKAFPLPTIAWFKGDEPCDQSCDTSSDPTRTSTFSELSLNNITESANYTCVASNDLGSVKALSNVKVDFQKPAIKDPKQKDYFVLIGGSISIQCAAQGLPEPTVRWSKGSSEVSQGNTLKIEGFSNKDDGVYTCNAENFHGKDQVQISVKAVKPTTVNVDHFDLKLDAGSAATLNCSASVDPNLGVDRKWTKDAERIESNQTFLEFKYLTVQDHEGTYKCLIETQVDSKEIQWSLKVNANPPKFNQSRTQSKVLKGRNFTLDCPVVSGIPKPETNWYFEGKKLNEATITNAQKSNQGTYSCIAVNEYGSSETHLQLDVLEPTNVTVDPNFLTPETLSTVELRCQVDHDPRTEKVSLKWLKDSVEISTESVLKLDQVTLEDSGMYECQVQTENFEFINASSQINVIGVSPSFISTDKDVRVLEGATARLKCQANGLPLPKVSWNVSLDDHRMSVAALGDLVISQVEKQDEGSYRCNASNLYGSISTAVKVHVISKLHKVNTTLYKEVQADSGDVDLDCDVQIDARIKEPKIKWYFLDPEVGKFKVISETSPRLSMSNRTLQISNPTSADMGMYQCTVKTPFETTSLNISLKVFGEQPIIISKFQSISLMQNDTKTLSCIAKGVPVPQITWILDDTPINQSVKVLSEKDRSESILSMNKVTSGNYSCEANNQYGSSISKVAEIYVIKPTTASISDTGEKLRVNAGSRLTIPCHFAYDRKNKVTGVEWMKDGKEISITSKDRVDFGMDGSIMIADVQNRHEGEYTCLVTTAHDYANASVVVEVVVNAPVITSVSKNQVIFSGSSVALICNAKGLPTPEITWTFNGTKTDVTGPEFRILKAMVTDIGAYKCTAKNQYGETSKTINFDVVLLPNLAPDYVTEQGKNLSIPCVDPAKYKGISVVWTMGDKLIESHHGTLTIDQVGPKDIGDYTCILLSNERRKVLKTRVIFKKKVIVNTSGTLISSPGESLTLECNILQGIQAKRLWRFNGDFFSGASTRKALVENGQFLKITHLSPEDAGEYTCQASSPTTTDSITFKVEISSSSPSNVKPGCDFRISITDISGLDNSSVSVKWQFPDGFNRSCYESLKLVWWSKGSANFYSQDLNLDQAEAVLKSLNSTLRYYVQVSLVSVGARSIIEGETRSFTIFEVTKPQQFKQAENLMYGYGLTIVLVTVGVTSVALFVVTLVMYKKGLCPCKRNDRKPDPHFGKTNFNGFDSNSYHASIIPLDVGYRTSTPQWPEPEDKANSSFDEQDPFIQRCSTFSPTSSTSAASSLQPQPSQPHRHRRGSKTSISSSWSSLFNVPVVNSTLTLNNQHPTDPNDRSRDCTTFGPRKSQL